MDNFRTNTIKAVKAMNITPQELGYEDGTKWKTAFEASRREFYSFMSQVSEFIQNTSDKESAREYFNEDYWEDLGIDDKKYKIVEVELTKTVSTKIQVVMPMNEESYNVEDYIENMDYLDATDEEDWEISDHYDIESDLTEEWIKSNYSGEVIWNFEDFDEQ